MSGKDTRNAARRDRMLVDNNHDAYRVKGKPLAPATCMNCGSVFENGRWKWGRVENTASREICPACRRIRDRFPAGEIEIKGAFYKEHAEEILNRVRNIENLEKSRHPLERIMTIRQDAESATIATTGVHLARRIGEAISGSFSGSLKMNYLRQDENIRVYWER